MYKYQIFKGQNDQYYFRLKAGNGETILSSEGYTTKQSCEAGIASVRVHSPFDENYVRLTSSNSQYYFNLRAKNWEVIGKSETYTTSYARDNGIDAVKREGPFAPVEDLTLSNSYY
ncbi:MAG: YegP family protein [Chitinophagales bacterium]|nr:YegP family protein [Chitinophagales bacterium]